MSRKVLVEITVADGDSDERLLEEIDGHLVISARVVKEPHVILAGSPVDGVTLYGPYSGGEAAVDAMPDLNTLDSCWVAPLEPPPVDAEGAARQALAKAARPLAASDDWSLQ